MMVLQLVLAHLILKPSEIGVMSVIDLAFVVDHRKQIVLVHALRARVANRKDGSLVKCSLEKFSLSDVRQSESSGVFPRAVGILHGK